MTCFVGIDGGGTHLRVVAVDSALKILGESHAGSANPSVIGHHQAAALIQDNVIKALQNAGLPVIEVTSVGIGIAGAAVSHSEAWLREVFQPILPNAFVVPSSDVEIALVGAHGCRQGIIVLAGTGSVAYGVNAKGESLQVGGWGYMMGDEGSGYWIGREALRIVIDQYDRGDALSDFGRKLLNNLALTSPFELIPWQYRSQSPRTSETAQLAKIVLEFAQQRDPAALDIINRAVEALVRLCEILSTRLELSTKQTAFAGGLLSNENLLSEKLYKRLELISFPVPKYSPVIGAALLAKLMYEQAID